MTWRFNTAEGCHALQTWSEKIARFLKEERALSLLIALLGSPRELS